MNWIPIHGVSDLETIRQKSANKAQVIFKHSTRCSISSMAKHRLERGTAPDNIDFNFLDLIAHRDISARVAEDFSVEHESPQVLVIRGGKCVYDESHTSISMDEIKVQAGVV